MSWGGYIPGELLNDPEFATRLKEEMKLLEGQGMAGYAIRPGEVPVERDSDLQSQ